MQLTKALDTFYQMYTEKTFVSFLTIYLYAKQWTLIRSLCTILKHIGS